MTSIADSIVTMVDNTERLWPHNEQAVEDVGISTAVVAALGKPRQDGGRVELLRPARPGSQDRNLLDAVLGDDETWDWAEYYSPCDRCLRDVPPEHSLWVPAPPSVIALHCCRTCRAELDADLPGLVWR